VHVEVVALEARLQQIREWARELVPFLVEVRRDLHRHPELAWEEVRTTGRIKETLGGAGIPVLPLDLPTGAAAEVGTRGPTIALRADIDALPVEEEAPVPFRSTVPGKMHACGHDFHTAVMLGASLILKQMEAELNGRARILFQPAEERVEGAQRMIEAGALDGVACILGMHNNPALPCGTIGVRAGPLMAATDGFDIEIRGMGGHAALPDLTVDPIVAGSAIVMALQTAVSRSVSPLEPAVVSVTQFLAGSTFNVIPPAARLTGTVRTCSPDVRRKLLDRVERIAREVAGGFGAGAEIRWVPGTPAVTNDPAMASLMRAAGAALLGPEGVVDAEPTMGAEDFARYQERVPGCFIWLGTGNQAEGIVHGWHHPGFMVDERALETGAALFAYAALLAMERSPLPQQV
jgi:N-acetylcysteine deacetylase